jgi:hypothetical protein
MCLRELTCLQGHGSELISREDLEMIELVPKQLSNAGDFIAGAATLDVADLEQVGLGVFVVSSLTIRLTPLTTDSHTRVCTDLSGSRRATAHGEGGKGGNLNGCSASSPP